MIIRHTTSKNCLDNEVAEGEFDEDGKPRPLRVHFRSRSCCNMISFVCYRFWRLFYIVYFFYLIPPLVLINSIVFPFYLGVEAVCGQIDLIPSVFTSAKCTSV